MSADSLSESFNRNLGFYGISCERVTVPGIARTTYRFSSTKGERFVTFRPEGTEQLWAELKAAVSALATKNLRPRDPLVIDVGASPHRFAGPAL